MLKQMPLYEEKQYLGYNRISALIRTVLALLCFAGFYWSQNPKPIDLSGIHIGSYPVEEIPASGHIFFILGLFIMVLSVLLMYVLHIQTSVYVCKLHYMSICMIHPNA